MSRRNGHGPDWKPVDVGRWAPIVEAIKSEGAGVGFRKARDLCFTDFEVLSERIPAYALLKLAIEFDRHGMACDEQAARSAGNAADAFEWYQKYLQGEVDVAPMAGTPERIRLTDTASVETDAEEDV